jgi:outer membrane protein assembly factor BamE (lipoprotein component of BamABCDE complex)
MSLSAFRRLTPVFAILVVGSALAACSPTSLSLTQNRQRGYEITDDMLAQIRPGQSAALVTAVLGSPQATNNFDNEHAWYYLSEKVQQTAFGMAVSKERTLLAVYFDKNDKVTDSERLGMKDGKTFTIESRRTPSYGEDRTFLESIISSI